MIFFLTNWNEWELFLPFIETQVKTRRVALQEEHGLADSSHCTWVLRSVYEKAFPSIIITLENYAEKSVQVLLLIRTRCLRKCCRDLQKKKKKSFEERWRPRLSRRRKRCWLSWAAVAFKRSGVETGCKRNGSTSFVGSGTRYALTETGTKRVWPLCEHAARQFLLKRGQERDVEGILWCLHVSVESHWSLLEYTWQISFNCHSSEYLRTSSPLEDCVEMDSEGAFRLSGKGYQSGVINAWIDEGHAGATPR